MNNKKHLRQERQKHDNPQPLTLEQLGQRVGKPVYVGRLVIQQKRGRGIIELKERK